MLGINGEGRVSPIIPGCQQITSVVAPNGETLILNKIWPTAAGAEGSGDKGQRSIDMAPAMPHTTTRQARTCTSCHAESKALGYGTHDGRYMKQYAKGVYVDIANEKGQLVTQTAVYQISPVPDLPMDLDQVVTREGEQLQTVGHHWPKFGPLPKETRDNMERVGVCLSCHKEIPTERFVYRVIAKIGSITGLAPKTDAAHQKLIGRAMFIAANMEIFGVLIGAIVVLVIIVYFARRKRA